MSLLDTALESGIHPRATGRMGRATAASVLAAAEPVLFRLAVITFLFVLAVLMFLGLVLGPLIRGIRRRRWKAASHRVTEDAEAPATVLLNRREATDNP